MSLNLDEEGRTVFPGSLFLLGLLIRSFVILSCSPEAVRGTLIPFKGCKSLPALPFVVSSGVRSLYLG